MDLSLDEVVPIEVIKERKRKRVSAKGRKVGGVERLSRQIGRIVDDEEIKVGFKKKKIMVVMFLKVERWRD